MYTRIQTYITFFEVSYEKFILFLFVFLHLCLFTYVIQLVYFDQFCSIYTSHSNIWWETNMNFLMEKI